jgi:phosphatidylcholine synthase
MTMSGSVYQAISSQAVADRARKGDDIPPARRLCHCGGDDPIAHSMNEPLIVSKGAWAGAFGVHIFTALGAGLGLLAMLEAVEGRWSRMFAWLAVALAVDAVDGMLARRFRVRDNAPRWSGDTLDLVVDILTWVFVPAFALATGGIFPPGFEVPLALIIVVTSVLYFADTKMKAGDNFFMGFPGAWNVVAFFLFLLRPNPMVAAGLTLLLCVLTFVPLPFVHPFRVQRGRWLTAVLLATGGILTIVALVNDLRPSTWVTFSLCGVCFYFLMAGFWRKWS